MYCGAVGLALVAVAIVSRRNPYTLAFLLLTLAGGFWMLGEHTPVGRTIFRLLPNAVKAPLYAEYAMPIFALGMAVLAGLGAHRLLEDFHQLTLDGPVIPRGALTQGIREIAGNILDRETDRHGAILSP